MKPVTRLETLVQAIIEGSDLPFSAVDRIEMFLSDIISGQVSSIAPATRLETYLAKISGQDIDVPTPITRIECFLAAISGRNVNLLTPITRLEMLLNAWADSAASHTLSGPIVSFLGKSSTEILSVTAAIDPVQDLHGYDHPWPGGGGKNLANFVNGYNIATDGSVVPFESRAATVDPISIESGVSYIYTSETGKGCIYAVFDNGTLVRRKTSIASGSTLDTSDGTDLYVCCYGVTATVEADKPMVRKSTEPAGYVPYSNICPITGWTGANAYVSPTQDVADATVYNVDWTSGAGTVYAGTYDAVSGKLKARPQYSAYNGETLVGPWLSSMDVYAAGTTPTTGAQVVDLGGTETVYTLTPQTVAALVGQNYVWADTGDVSVTVKNIVPQQ